MALTIEDSILEAIHLSENELRLEFAIFLYQTRKLTLSQAKQNKVLEYIKPILNDLKEKADFWVSEELY